MGQVDVCNRVLSLVGTRSTILSMSERSPEARQCGLHWTPTLRALLRSHSWAFAKRTATLALLHAASGTTENPSGATTGPPQPWLYSYVLPNDCLRVRSVHPTADASWLGLGNPDSVLTRMPTADFSIGLDADETGNSVRVIFSNQTGAVAVYTAYMPNPDAWDDDFGEAFTYALAAKIAGPLTGDKSLVQMFLSQMRDHVALARAVDGNESPNLPEHIPDWISDRGFDASWSGY